MRQDVSVSKVKHPRYTHRVRYPGPEGKTVQSWFKSETAANDFAKKKRKESGREGRAFGTLGRDERAVIEFWRTFTSENNSPTPPPLIDVVKDFADRWRQSRSSVTVAKAVDAYEASKKAEGLRPTSVQSIRTRCARFTTDFGKRPMASITTAEISDWILGLESTTGGKPASLSLQAKRNHRLALSGLFNFAKSRGWVTENPVEDAARPKPPKKRPGIMPPEHVGLFMSAMEKVDAGLVAFWALRFFAGIREQEVLRMDWTMIDLEAGEIHLPDGVTKTGRDRSVKIQPALDSWIRHHAATNGPVTEHTEMARRWALKKAKREIDAALAKRAKQGREPETFTMPPNAARHSFATFHLIRFRKPGETSMQLGHEGNPAMLHRHYKGTGTATQAKAFWALRRENPKNVTKMRRKSA